jgi:hypothetical protein
MPNSYDIFRQNEEGDPVWVEAVTGLNEVKKRLVSLSSVKPGKYLVYDFAKAKLVEPFKKSA